MKRVWYSFVFLIACACAPEMPGSSSVEDLVMPRSPELTRATAEYGPLIVREGEFEAESAVKPWSSWWYPIRETYLFQGTPINPSPLEKYDEYVREKYRTDAGSARYERENLYDPNAAGWEGLCNAWAVASVMEREPKKSIKIGRVVFNVGDLKALTVKSYESLEGLTQFGQRFNGDRYGVFDDIYPDQLHKIMQSELFDRGRPFIIDKDPGVAVWNTPIWKSVMRIEKSPHSESVMHVNAWLFGASPFVESYDYVGTLSVVFQYTYDLHGRWQADGSFRVDYGQWTGDSVDFHPDFASVLPETAKRQSLNPKINVTYVDEILQQARR